MNRFNFPTWTYKSQYHYTKSPRHSHPSPRLSNISVPKHIRNVSSEDSTEDIAAAVAYGRGVKQRGLGKYYPVLTRKHYTIPLVTLHAVKHCENETIEVWRRVRGLGGEKFQVPCLAQRFSLPKSFLLNSRIESCSSQLVRGLLCKPSPSLPQALETIPAWNLVCRTRTDTSFRAATMCHTVRWM